MNGRQSLFFPFYKFKSVNVSFITFEALHAPVHIGVTGRAPEHTGAGAPVLTMLALHRVAAISS